ncbi:ester cyclase [Candidatus Magnetomorum sp. HK-1]|nr:ester cyclase [Candidatus Magnetomorum sp. HK-1]
MANDIKEQIKLGNNELFEKGNLNIVNEIFITDYIVHAGNKEYKGHKFIKQFFNRLRSAIHNIQVMKIEFYCKTKDTIVWQRSMHRTLTARLMLNIIFLLRKYIYERTILY